jgi:hypothetical protein
MLAILDLAPPPADDPDYRTSLERAGAERWLAGWSAWPDAMNAILLNRVEPALFLAARALLAYVVPLVA